MVALTASAKVKQIRAAFVAEKQIHSTRFYNDFIKIGVYHSLNYKYYDPISGTYTYYPTSRMSFVRQTDSVYCNLSPKKTIAATPSVEKKHAYSISTQSSWAGDIYFWSCLFIGVLAVLILCMVIYTVRGEHGKDHSARLQQPQFVPDYIVLANGGGMLLRSIK